MEAAPLLRTQDCGLHHVPARRSDEPDGGHALQVDRDDQAGAAGAGVESQRAQWHAVALVRHELDGVGPGAIRAIDGHEDPRGRPAVAVTTPAWTRPGPSSRAASN